MALSAHLYSDALTTYITITTLLDQHRELSDHIHQFLTFERNDTDQRYADVFRSASSPSADQLTRPPTMDGEAVHLDSVSAHPELLPSTFQSSSKLMLDLQSNDQLDCIYPDRHHVSFPSLIHFSPSHIRHTCGTTRS